MVIGNCFAALDTICLANVCFANAFISSTYAAQESAPSELSAPSLPLLPNTDLSNSIRPLDSGTIFDPGTTLDQTSQDQPIVPNKLNTTANVLVTNQKATLEQALSLENDQSFERAAEHYLALIKQLETTSGIYQIDLTSPLIGLARSYIALGKYTEAVAAIQRAQHISHRHEGVYSARQLAGIDLMTHIHIGKEEIRQANQQQQFAFFIAKHNITNDPMALIPAFTRINHWYITTGQLEHARRSLNQSENLIRANMSEFDPQLLETIYQQAMVRRLQKFCCSHKLLEPVLPLVESSKYITTQQRAQFYLQLADAYTMSAIDTKAADYYRLAWAIMNNTQRTRHFSRPRKIAFAKLLNEGRDTQDLNLYKINNRLYGRSTSDIQRLNAQEKLFLASLPPQEFFLPLLGNNYNLQIAERSVGSSSKREYAHTIGSPFQFLRTQLTQLLPLRLQHHEVLAQLAIELIFTVGVEGNVYNITTASNNTPPKINRLMREVLRKSKFRPRLDKGEPVETKQVRLLQTFHTI